MEDQQANEDRMRTASSPLLLLLQEWQKRLELHFKFIYFPRRKFECADYPFPFFFSSSSSHRLIWDLHGFFLLLCQENEDDYGDECIRRGEVMERAPGFSPVGLCSVIFGNQYWFIARKDFPANFLRETRAK